MRMMEPKLRIGPVIWGQRTRSSGGWRCSYWLWPFCWRSVGGEATLAVVSASCERHPWSLIMRLPLTSATIMRYCRKMRR